MNRKFSIVLILFAFCSMFTGCYDRTEIDDLTYVIAIGLDKGTIEPLRLTLQYAIPKSLGGGGGGGGGEGGGDKALQNMTIETPSLYSGLNMANGFIGKQVNLSHAKVIVVSEELAREDVGRYIYGIVRGREFRPNMYMAVCRGDAESYLKAIKPSQEVDPTKYYELIFSAYRYTGFTANSQYFRFYSQVKSYGTQAVAVLAGLGKYESTEQFKKEDVISSEKGRVQPFPGDFKAGDIPKVGDQKGEVMGLAVFDGSKMVGEMDGEDSTDYLMITGEYNNSYFTIPDPKMPDKDVILNLKQSRKPIRKVKIVDGKPQITVGIMLEGDFIAIQSGFNYEDPKNLPIIEDTASNFLKDAVTKFLNRTAGQYHVDICGFGKEAKRNFLTMDEWKNFNWLSKYQDAAFNVDVTLKIRRLGLIVRTSPIISQQGKETTQ